MRALTCFALVIAFALVLLFDRVANAATAADQRGYAAGVVALQIGNESHIVRSVEGGTVRGETTTEPATGNKHISRAVVEPVRAKIAPDEFTSFLADALGAGGDKRVNGSVVMLDYDFKVQRQRDFTNALFTEVTIPELSGAAKEAAALTIALQPETVRESKGGTAPLPKTGEKAKKWTGNFAMSLAGTKMSRVRSIESFTARRAMADNPVGEMRDIAKMPAGAWQISNIVFSVGEQDAAPLETWFDDFVVKGNNGDDKEKTLDIDLLDVAMKPFATIHFTGVGIVSIKPEATADAAAREMGERVELYVEHMTISGGGAKAAEAAPAPAAPPPPAAAAPTDAAAPAKVAVPSKTRVRRPPPQ